MVERLGKVLYWACCAFSGISAAIGVATLFGSAPWLIVFFGLAALALYGVGRGIRYVLVGR
jgi:hypothetical protein